MCMMSGDKTKNALAKSGVPAVGLAATYYFVMCSVFGMGKGACLGGALSFGIAVFVGLSLIYRR